MALGPTPAWQEDAQLCPFLVCQRLDRHRVSGTEPHVGNDTGDEGWGGLSWACPGLAWGDPTPTPVPQQHSQEPSEVGTAQAGPGRGFSEETEKDDFNRSRVRVPTCFRRPLLPQHTHTHTGGHRGCPECPAKCVPPPRLLSLYPITPTRPWGSTGAERRGSRLLMCAHAGTRGRRATGAPPRHRIAA